MKALQHRYILEFNFFKAQDDMFANSSIVVITDNWNVISEGMSRSHFV